MTSTLEELEKQARALKPSEKAALAHILIEQLDASSDVDAERLWVELAQQRDEDAAIPEITSMPFKLLWINPTNG